jgi:PAS domain S-box-containing protein
MGFQGFLPFLTLSSSYQSLHSAEAPNNSTVVTPGQSVDEAQTNGVAQARQIITQHAAVGMHQQQPVQQQPTHVAPMPLPTPLISQAPVVAAHGIALPPAPISYAQPRTHIAPAPIAQASSTSRGLPANAIRQPGTVVAKRRRIDGPVAVTSTGARPPVMTETADVLQGRGRKKTQAQIDRRRERNRILARRTRLRKKFFFESLQKEVIELQRENSALKDIVRSELKDNGTKILEDCNASEKLPEAVIEACGEHASGMGQEDFNLVKSIQQSQHSFVITDPSLQDNPIVFASDDFLSLTGYSREDVLGRNCRFLQGTETSQEKLDEIRKGLTIGSDVSVTLINYTADGTPFWNKLFIAALRDAQDNIVNFIGVIVKVLSPEPTDPEHGKKLPMTDSGDESYEQAENLDCSTAAMAADGTVKAIESVVDAAVTAAPPVVHS